METLEYSTLVEKTIFEQIYDDAKPRKLYARHLLPMNSFKGTKFYSSKRECEKARDDCIMEAYRRAENYLLSNSVKSIAKEAADFYSKLLKEASEPHFFELKDLADKTGKTTLFATFQGKIVSAPKSLLASFKEELEENRDYYSMYEYRYFLEQTSISEHDHRFSEEFFFRFLEKMFTESVTYTIDNITTVISEIQSDLDSMASTFFGVAEKIYSEYYEEVMEILRKLEDCSNQLY